MKSQPQSALISAITMVLTVLILSDGLSPPIVLAVAVVLIFLIMVIGNAAHLLPELIKTILGKIRIFWHQ